MKGQGRRRREGYGKGGEGKRRENQTGTCFPSL